MTESTGIMELLRREAARDHSGVISTKLLGRVRFRQIGNDKTGPQYAPIIPPEIRQIAKRYGLEIMGESF